MTFKNDFMFLELKTCFQNSKTFFIMFFETKVCLRLEILSICFLIVQLFFKTIKTIKIYYKKILSFQKLFL